MAEIFGNIKQLVIALKAYLLSHIEVIFNERF